MRPRPLVLPWCWPPAPLLSPALEGWVDVVGIWFFDMTPTAVREPISSLRRRFLQQCRDRSRVELDREGEMTSGIMCPGFHTIFVRVGKKRPLSS